MKPFISTLRNNSSELVARINQWRASPAISSAFWVVASNGGNQVIRLIGNLILTRLLYPEIFGIMAIVYAVMIGLGQMSDIGLREGVVNSNRIGDPHFMKTAWTLQILQSLFFALVATAIAWPIAYLYDEAILAPVLIMTGIAISIEGFKSIALLAYDKRLDLKRQMQVDLGVAFVGMVFIIVWSWISPSIWALVAGHIFSSVLVVVLSYALFEGHYSKLAWERDAVRDLFNFGKWILLSSSISFVTNQGDKLIMGLWLTLGELGQYSIASTWAGITMLISYSLSVRVLHPYFKQSIDNTEDFAQVHKTRKLLNFLYLAICVGLALCGSHLIAFLYDDRYQEAGWMLQILAVGQFGRNLTGTLRPFLTASGDSFSQMKTSAASAVILLVFLLAGGWLGQTPGIIIAYSIAGIAMHPVMVIYAHNHGYHCFRSDMMPIAIAALVVLTGWWILDAPILNVLSGIIYP